MYKRVSISLGRDWKALILAMGVVSLTACGGGTTTNDDIPIIISVPTNFSVTSGDASAVLSWNLVTGADSYTVYYAEDASFTAGNYSSFTGGTMVANASSPLTLTGLNNGTSYYAIVTANKGGVESEAAEKKALAPTAPVVTPPVTPPVIPPVTPPVIPPVTPPVIPPAVDASAPLNDTGIIFGGHYPGGNTAGACIGVSGFAQDCAHGPDSSDTPNHDNGYAGFDFTKIGASGEELSLNATQWSCVRDNITGYMWEVKATADSTIGSSGLHDPDDSYVWYDATAKNNAGGAATGYAKPDSDAVLCSGYTAGSSDTASFCNTQAFAARVNAEGYCGRTDWKVPSRKEMRSIVHHGKNYLVIDESFFPNTSYNFYWSSNAVADNSGEDWKYARAINFTNGEVENKPRWGAFPTRLVANTQ